VVPKYLPDEMLYVNAILQDYRSSQRFPEAKWTTSFCKPIGFTGIRGRSVGRIFPKEWCFFPPGQSTRNLDLKHLEQRLLDGAVSPDFQAIYSSRWLLEN
jgi:hypothetical protein